MSVSVFHFPLLPSDPISFWQQIHPHPAQAFFLGSPLSPDKSSLYMSAANPLRSWTLHSTQDFKDLEKACRPSKTSVGLPYPRFSGVFYFEAMRLFDSALKRLPSYPNPLKTPAAEWADYPCVIRLDARKMRTTLFIDGRVSVQQKAALKENVKRLLHQKFPAKLDEKKPLLRYRVAPQKTFAKKVHATKDHIRAGDIYQANLSLRFSAPFSKDPVQLYRAICQRNPSPYSCLYKTKQGWLVSSSPELLLATEGRRIRTRPIAGTRPRGATPRNDRRLRGQLLLSPKERAEHIMLVDLERNDLGRVCVPGSVHVSERSVIEKYSHVMHIVSEVKGLLRKGETAFSALKALFPGGTITGCPKIKSIEIIGAMEKLARGPFYGSAGFIANNGDAMFNILIRSAFIQNKKIYLQAGAGIVADSDPVREYREVLAKARVMVEVSSSC